MSAVLIVCFALGLMAISDISFTLGEWNLVQGLKVPYPGILFEGGVQQIQLRTEDRENGDLGTVAP